MGEDWGESGIQKALKARMDLPYEIEKERIRRLARRKVDEEMGASQAPIPKLRWKGKRRAFADLILWAYKEKLIEATSATNALEQAILHVEHVDGKPMNARALLQSIKNRDDTEKDTRRNSR